MLTAYTRVLIITPTTGGTNVYKSDTLSELPAALIALQPDLKPIHMDGAGHANRRYATLNAVMSFLRPILEKHGFALVQTTLSNGRGAALETVLLHKSGEYISSTIDVPVSKQNDPQAYGSALTYGRRYSTMALLGLTAKEEDDDGQAAVTTLQERLADIFFAQTLEDLNTARVKHETASGLDRVETYAIKAALKVMSESLSRQP